MSSERARAALRTSAVALAVALVAGLAWRRALELPLYGWDTFPLIASCRAESAADLARIATSELLGGAPAWDPSNAEFRGGRYFRPLTQLSFALDGAALGLDARAYHALDLALLAACAACVALLALALLGGERWRSALVAGAVFAFHPAVLEALPRPPRRADSLALLFTLLAALAASKRARWIASVASLAAVASKESGALAPALVFVLAVAASAGGARARLAAAWRAAWPSLAATVAFLASRAAVVGGLGGGPRASLAGAFAQVADVTHRAAALALAPFAAGDAPVLALSAALALAALVFAARGRGGERVAAWLASAWIAGACAVIAVAGTFRAWYALPLAAPIALIAAAASARAFERARAHPLRWVVSAGTIAFLVACQRASHARWSEIDAAAAAARDVLSRFDAAVERAAPGSELELDVAPPPGSTRGGIERQKAAVFADYSLQAYAELRFPDRPIRVVARGREVGARAPDEVLIRIATR
jgi:hypothetical protein